jgi:hypothetical protein
MATPDGYSDQAGNDHSGHHHVFGHLINGITTVISPHQVASIALLLVEVYELNHAWS